MDTIQAYKLNTARNHSGQHYHDSMELYIFLGDTMQYFLGDKIYNLTKNDVMVINRYNYHKTNYLVSEDPSRINLSFDISELDILKDQPLMSEICRFLSATKYIKAGTYDHQAFTVSIEQLMLLCEKKESSPFISARKRMLLFSILFILMEKSQKDIKENDLPGQPRDLDHRISDIIDHINDSFAARIALESTSSGFGISKYYLCRKFSQFTGIGITDFINSKRLYEAKKLLENTDYRISRVSELVGFNSLTYFIRLFKKQYHKTPGEYRKTLCNF